MPQLEELEALVVFQAKYCYNLEVLLDMKKLTNLLELNLNNSCLINALPSLRHLVSLQKMVIKYEILEVGYDLHNLTRLVTLDVIGWSEDRILSASNLTNLEGLITRCSRRANVLASLLNLTKLQRFFYINPSSKTFHVWAT